MIAIIGIGLPGCGKTTVLKPLAKEKKLDYVNADDIRLEVTKDATDHTREKLVWDILYQRVKAALQEKGVVIDVTNTKPKDRKQMTNFCRQNGATKIIGYWVQAPVEVCAARNAARARSVPPEVLCKLSNRLNINPPALEEGFDEIKAVRTD